MFSTTFYSFKGGVGRTLALVNVAVEIAKDGNDVAIIDFDLEAPGLQTFGIFGEKKQPKVGLVEYVNEYLKSATQNNNEVPKIDRFLYEADPKLLKNFSDSHAFANSKSVPGAKGKFSSTEQGKIWLMPARGKTSDQNPTSINWEDLYENYDGYYLMEELKAQIEAFSKADYLFIDSRTGFSDHSFICTNQLADALAVIFYPNDQNLIGLQEVLSDLRKNQSVDEKNIKFVASRIPTGDDESQILENKISLFQDKLAIKQPPLRLHQNSSFGLLEQEIFTLTKTEQTQLFRDYVELALEIESLNPQSKRGTHEFFNREIRNFRDEELEEKFKNEDFREQVEERVVTAIGNFFYDDFLLYQTNRTLLHIDQNANHQFPNIRIYDAMLMNHLIACEVIFKNSDVGIEDIEDENNFMLRLLTVLVFDRASISCKDLFSMTYEELLRLSFKKNASKLIELSKTTYADQKKRLLDSDTSVPPILDDDEVIWKKKLGTTMGLIVYTLLSEYRNMLSDDKLFLSIEEPSTLSEIEAMQSNRDKYQQHSDQYLNALILYWYQESVINGERVEFGYLEKNIFRHAAPRFFRKSINRVLTLDEADGPEYALFKAFQFGFERFTAPFPLKEDFLVFKPIALKLKDQGFAVDAFPDFDDPRVKRLGEDEPHVITFLMLLEVLLHSNLDAKDRVALLKDFRESPQLGNVSWCLGCAIIEKLAGDDERAILAIEYAEGAIDEDSSPLEEALFYSVNIEFKYFSPLWFEMLDCSRQLDDFAFIRDASGLDLRDHYLKMQ